MKTEDKWQAEREHFAKGGRVQARSRHEFPATSGMKWSQWYDIKAFPQFSSDCEFRIHPDDKPVEAPAAQEKWEPRVGDKVMMGDKIETIEEVTSGSTPYRLKGWGGFIAKSLIRPAPSTDKWEPRFKVGDRVKFRTQGGGEDTIESINEDHTYFCKVSGLKWSEELLEWQLPTPPAGQQWHRTDGWKAEWLPSGWRPLLEDEKCEEGDEIFSEVRGSVWRKQTEIQVGLPARKGAAHQRTRRPAPTQPATNKMAGAGDMRATFEAAMLRNGFFSLPDSWNEQAKCYNHTHQAMWVAWQSAIAFASSAETQENLIVPDEGNVRYWTQRILDTITLEKWAEINIEAVIRELLTKDTHYAAAGTNSVPSVEELVDIYRKRFTEAGDDGLCTSDCQEEGISAVREACMAHFKGLIYQARLANDRCANAMFDKEQAINRQAEQMSRAESAEAKVKQLEDEADRIAKHVGAPTLTEAFDVLIRTKAQDEDVIAQQFATIKRQASEAQTADALRREVEVLKGERDNAIKHWNEALQLIPVPPSTEEKPPIITTHVYPPIPMRHHDWCAYRQGQEDGLLGWGLTEDLAKADLINQEEF